MNPKIIAPVAVLALAFAGTTLLMLNSRQLSPSAPEAVCARGQGGSCGALQCAHGRSRQGTVSPRTQADLVPEVSGNVLWVSANLVSGGYFEAGEPLLRIDDRDYRNTVQRARAAVSRAQAEQEFAHFELQRLEEMKARQLISRSDVETGMRTARVADASRADAEAALEQAERDLSRTEPGGSVCGPGEKRAGPTPGSSSAAGRR